MILYFSGTGNSRFAAEVIENRIHDTCINAFDYIKNGRKGDFHSAAAYVFVSPTYSWRLPRLFEKFLKNSRFSGCKQAYFVMTCGSEIGNSEPYLKKLCSACGFEFMGVQQVIMPENYIAMFSVPDKQTADGIIRNAVPSLAHAAEQIVQMQPFDAHKVSLADRVKSGFVNNLFYTFIVSARDFKVKENCIACGKCVSACPLNNIKLNDSKPVWGNDCTHCMACISLCPVRAIEYGNASKNRNRFYNTYHPNDMVK